MKYGWWKKSQTTTSDGQKNPINNGIIIILGGAGFLPSTVCLIGKSCDFQSLVVWFTGRYQDGIKMYLRIFMVCQTWQFQADFVALGVEGCAAVRRFVQSGNDLRGKWPHQKMISGCCPFHSSTRDWSWHLFISFSSSNGSVTTSTKRLCVVMFLAGSFAILSGAALLPSHRQSCETMVLSLKNWVTG